MVHGKPVWNPVSMPEAPVTSEAFAARTAEEAVRALLREAEAGPKPGLVDRFGPGVHTDMDISHFRLSAAALRPFFEAITLEAALPTDALAETLRNLGLQAESAMLAATGGINTHKGAIWTLGLLCAGVGSLIGIKDSMAARSSPVFGPSKQDHPVEFLQSVPTSREAGSGCLDAEAVCAQAACHAQAILSLGAGRHSGTYLGPEMDAVPPPENTNGLSARRTYGLRSARDEALDGFPSIQTLALPMARSLRNSMLSEDEKVISVLLAVMCQADDTCLAARGGLPALELAKSAARAVLDAGGLLSGAGGILYRRMVTDFESRKLSPGGSADLCAATLFLDGMEVWLADCRLGC